MIELSVLSENVIPLEVYMPTGGGITPTGTKSITITENGTYTEDVTSYANAEIDVSVSGGAVNNQNKTVNPSTVQQSVTADAGYTGLGTVTVTAMPSGTEGTPTATKGAVSNHSVSVTPSVTNTEGYIEGGTHNGTAVSVSASELVSGTKSVTSNGSGIDVTNYASIDVAVPNSYSASDEGKVVSSGALVSQSSATYTANDTYDTTLVNEVTVNVSGGGGDDYLAMRLNNTLTSYESDVPTKIHDFSFRNASSLTHLSLPNVTRIETSGLSYCNGLTSLFFENLTTTTNSSVINNANLETFVSKKAIYSSGGSDFQQNAKLKSWDVGNGSGRLSGNFFASDKVLDTIVIRSSSVTALASTNAFTSTPFASGGTGGTLYVPSSLISSYESATNWSTILGYTNNQIKSIESTHTDPNAPIDLTLYYADGTPIS